MFLRSTRLNADFELPEGTTIVGRAPDCGIVLQPSQVSRQHLYIRRQGALVEVRDEKSRSNSRVNGLEIQGLGWIKLKKYDLIEICGFEFRLFDEKRPDGVSGSCIVGSGTSDSEPGSLGSRSIPLSKLELSESLQNTQLRALLAITSTLRDVLQTEDVLQRAVSILFEIFPNIGRAAICFIDDAQVVQPKWWRVREGDPDGTIRISQNIGRHVAETSEAVITCDAKEDFGDAKSVYAGSMRSVMCCPLADAEDRVFGIIHVDSEVPNLFNEIDLEVLAAVALQIALAINCSRMHTTALADELLRKDIERAREVQQRYLPTAEPPIEGYDVAGFYRAAREVGGDYYDYVSLPDGRTAIVLGDVVGKGVPAALTMVRLATETRAGLEVCRTPSELLSRLNKRLANDFVTLIVMMLDPSSDVITFSNAGHEPPLHRTVEGTIKALGFDLSGCPIGVLEDGEYQDTRVALAEGETLLVFSDGFPDAEHKASDKRFGSDAIQDAFGKINGSAAEVVQEMVGRVDKFTEDSPQFDDMCMVCLRRMSDSNVG